MLLNSIYNLQNDVFVNLSGLKELKEVEIIKKSFLEFSKLLPQQIKWQDAWDLFKESENCTLALIVIKDINVRSHANKKGIVDEGEVRLFKALVEMTGDYEKAEWHYNNKQYNYIIGINNWQELIAMLLQLQTQKELSLPKLNKIKDDFKKSIKYLIENNWVQTQGVALNLNKNYYCKNFKDFINMLKKI